LAACVSDEPFGVCLAALKAIRASITEDDIRLAVPAVVKALGQKSKSVRKMAALVVRDLAMGKQSATLAAHLELIATLLEDGCDEVKMAIADGLTYYYAKCDDWDRVDDLLSHSDKDVRQEAVGTLKVGYDLDTQHIVSRAKRLLDDESADVRLVAARTLCEKARTPEDAFVAFPLVARRLPHQDDEQRLYAARTIHTALYNVLYPSRESTVEKRIDWTPFQAILPQMKQAMEDSSAKVKVSIGSSLCYYYLRNERPDDIIALLKSTKGDSRKKLLKSLEYDKYPQPNSLVGYLQQKDRSKLARRFRQAAKKKVKELSISGQSLDSVRLRALPSEIGLLVAVEHLDIGGNDLRELPSEIGRLKSLEVLVATRNHLTLLPPQFGQLVKLRTLYLYSNDLTELPAEFGLLRALQYLQITDNKLKALPESFGQLSQLQFLSLGGNQLRALPESFGQLQNLHECELKTNRLEGLPGSFGQLSQLRRLDLSNNNMTEIPPQVFELSNLESLSFGGNGLKELPRDIGKLRRLKTLYLRHNKLTRLPLELAGLPELEYIDVVQNKLRSLPLGLDKLEKLTWLDLEGNRLGLSKKQFHARHVAENLKFIYDKAQK
jgi:hypothetical protein